MMYKINGKVVTKEEWDAHGASRLQEALAARKFPGIQTEDTFKSAFGVNESQLSGRAGRGIRAGAAAIQRRNPEWSPKGKIHIGQLGHPADENSWIDRLSGRADAKRRLEATGQSCDGMVKVQERDVGPPPEKAKVAPDVVDRVARKLVAENPKMKVAEAREAAAEKLAPPKPEPIPDVRDVRGALERLAKDSKDSKKP